MLYLERVSQSKECKMPIANIAKVFAPTLVGYSCSKPEPVQMLSEAKIQPKVRMKSTQCAYNHLYNINVDLTDRHF